MVSEMPQQPQGGRNSQEARVCKSSGRRGVWGWTKKYKQDLDKGKGRSRGFWFGPWCGWGVNKAPRSDTSGGKS